MSSPSSSSCSASSASSDSADECWPHAPKFEGPNYHYVLDPLISDSDSEDASTDSSEDGANVVIRSGNVDWCKCGRCRPMQTEEASVCCREVQRMSGLVTNDETCITTHPTFRGGCLNIHALEIAYRGLEQNRPTLIEDPEIHSPTPPTLTPHD
ncbi:uncharacterized protein LOC144102321 [Amblyomma americanum]